MARRSNKTAHVLNLLAGHDSQNPAEETTNNDAVPSSSEAASENEPEQPVTKEEEKSDVPQPAKTDTESAAISPSVSAQNISVIDTTGTDPVAELIQQELTNQFESELAAISPGAAADTTTDEQNNEQQAAEAPEAADTDIPEAADTDMPESSVTDSKTAETPVTVTADSTPVTQATTEVPDTAAADSSASAQVTVPAQTTEETPKPHTADSIATDSETMKAAAIQPEPETAPEPEATPETEIVAEPKPEEPEVTTEPDTNVAAEPEPDFVYLNVMEEIVKDKIIYFMRQFDICTCDRCKADTIALTMNGLMPKYIVTTPAAVAPLISYYTNRLIPDVTVEAIKACMTVKDNPRH